MIIQIYKDVKSGERKRFPNGTWRPENGGFETFKQLLRYIVMEELKWTKSDLLALKFMDRFFKGHKLNGAVLILYNRHLHQPFIDSFPEWNLKKWQFGGNSGKTWGRTEKIEALTWFMEEKCAGSFEAIKENLTLAGLTDCGLKVIAHSYRYNLQLMMEDLFPGQDFGFVRERKYADHIRGEKHPFSTLTEELVRELKIKRKTEMMTSSQMAKLYPVSLTQAEQIVAGRTWKHIVV